MSKIEEALKSAVEKVWLKTPDPQRAAHKVRLALEEAGYVVVPREPTDEMVEAAHHRLAGDGNVSDVYSAMINAALTERGTGDE